MMSAHVELLSYSVVLVCLVMKVPQIYRVVQANTTEGINIKSLLLEFWCFNILLAYPTANGYPLAGYFEFILLVVQDIILLLLVLRDRGKLNAMNMSILVLFMSFIWSMAAGQLPEYILYSFMSTCTPLSATAKLMQLYTILKNKSAGSVSAGTWGMSVFTATTRIYTHYMTTADKMLMITSGQAAILNAAIFASILVYGGKPQEKIEITKIVKKE